MSLIGLPCTAEHFDRVVTRDESLTVDGRTVFVFRKGVISRPAANAARAAWADVDTLSRPSVTRRAAAGVLRAEAFATYRDDVVDVVRTSEHTGHLKLADGRVLKQPMSNPVLSYLAGYGVDRFTGRAKAHALTANYPERWGSSLPFFTEVDGVLLEQMPDVYARHLERISLHPEWRIPGTALSTVTINVNYESCFHLDTGDFKDGYSCLSVVEIGKYDGGYFVMPKHRIAIDVREGDVLLCQSHVDVHGNAPIVKHTPDAKRVSFVCYLKHALGRTKNARAA